MPLSLVRRVGNVPWFAASLALASCGGGGGGGAGGGSPSAPSTALAALTVSEGALSPAFSPDSVDYVVGPSLFPDSVTLTATASDPLAAVTVAGVPVASGAPSSAVPLPVGYTPVEVTVTSPDGLATRTYTVTFTRDGPTMRDAYVKASNTGAGDGFGTSIALDGDTLVVGAPGESSAATGVDAGAAAEADDSAPTSGAAYVYVRVGGAWTRQAYLKASNTDAGDRFGCAVAISGDTIVVGACREASYVTGVDAGQADQADDSEPGAGAAYVFVRSGGAWTQQAYLKASNTRPDAQFGRSVAISGDTIVVGSDLEDGAPPGPTLVTPQVTAVATDAGAAYVFTRSGTTWSPQAYLKAAVAGTGDRFGTSVAISGDTIVVGAPFEDSAYSGIDAGAGDDGSPDSGAAYVFQRASGSWTQAAYVKPSNTHWGDHFGGAVSVSGDTFVVGAALEDGIGRGVHTSGQATDVLVDSGAVYVFDRAGASWAETAYVKASNRDAGALFGSSVSVSGDTMIVGAPGESSGWTVVVPGAPESVDYGAPLSGAAYVFLRTDGVFAQCAYVKASNTGSGDSFGAAVATANGEIGVGAPAEDSAATGVNPGAAGEADDSAWSAGAVQLLR